MTLNTKKGKKGTVREIIARLYEEYAGYNDGFIAGEFENLLRLPDNSLQRMDTMNLLQDYRIERLANEA